MNLPIEIQQIVNEYAQDKNIYNDLVKHFNNQVSMLCYHAHWDDGWNIDPRDLSKLYTRDYDYDCGSYGDIRPTNKYISNNVFMKRDKLNKELKDNIRILTRKYNYRSRRRNIIPSERGFVRYFRHYIM